MPQPFSSSKAKKIVFVAALRLETKPWLGGPAGVAGLPKIGQIRAGSGILAPALAQVKPNKGLKQSQRAEAKARAQALEERERAIALQTREMAKAKAKALKERERAKERGREALQEREKEARNKAMPKTRKARGLKQSQMSLKSLGQTLTPPCKSKGAEDPGPNAPKRGQRIQRSRKKGLLEKSLVCGLKQGHNQNSKRGAKSGNK